MQKYKFATKKIVLKVEHQILLIPIHEDSADVTHGYNDKQCWALFLGDLTLQTNEDVFKKDAMAKLYNMWLISMDNIAFKYFPSIEYFSQMG